MKTRRKAEEQKSSEEILDEVKDNGEDYDKTIDELAEGGLDAAQPVGDNASGSTEAPVDKASTASVMHLVDTYIKAGVIASSDRFQAIDRMSSMRASAVRDQIKAAKLVMKASAKRASVRKADLEGWEEYEPGTFYKEFSNGLEGWVGNATGNVFGYIILNTADNDLNSGMLHSNDGFDSIEEAEAAADAWYEANKDSMAFASRHRAHRRLRRASIRKANLDGWETDDLGLSCHRYQNGYYAYAWDDSKGDAPGFIIWYEGVRVVHSQRNMTGTLEEIEAAADAWFEANKISLMTKSASRHARKRASAKKASKQKEEASVKIRPIRKASVNGWNEMEPGVEYKEYDNGYTAYAFNETSVGNGFDIYDGDGSLVDSEDLSGSIEDIEAAADAWVASTHDDSLY